MTGPYGHDATQADRHSTRERLPGNLTPFIRSFAAAARLVMRCLTRVRIEGDLKAIPREGPLIVAANHISNADGVLVGGWLTPALGRRIHWLGKREMLEWPIVGALAAHGSVHGVDRGAADVEAFRNAMRILEEGHVLMVFPEGTRSPTGALQEAKDGLAILALRSGATILPVGIAGTDRFWPKGSKVPRPGGSVTLRVGAPFRLADLLPEGGDRRARKAAATAEVMARIAALLPPRHRGAYAGLAEASPEPKKRAARPARSEHPPDEPERVEPAPERAAAPSGTAAPD